MDDAQLLVVCLAQLERADEESRASFAGALTHSHGLTDEEYAAIRALHEGGVAPAVTKPVWDYLLPVSLVRVDSDVRPPTVRLTPTGRSYPTD